MNCILVSDTVNCKHLEEFVGKSSSLNLVGTFTDSVSVKNQILKQHDIDLLILDIDILKMDFCDFISNLDYKPNIIVISSSDQFALKAFDISVVDYLLKPVTYSRFYKAVDKAVRFYSRMDVSNNIDNELYIKKDSSLVKLKLTDIIYIEALENYVALTTKNKKFIIHFTMKALMDQLPSSIFIRVDRSFIVNKNMINTINENSIDLTVGDTFKIVPIGKSFRELFLKNINIIS